ncbi:hypothetical protein FGG08_003857 [Glutinoglossum americanum]|uniref:Uncharacterized protein n=1 Tax=Glutinoglossum americanum TaxID=1670608 RepID=A0A9P8I6U8_9PEZI|nr:hypothetical protein FGG08_003857 [Glutinoglossum americanum]
MLPTPSALNPAIFSVPGPYRKLLSQFPQSPTHWLLTESNPHFSVQEIQCLFAVSGQYGDAPRAVFYILAVISVVLRTKPWIAATTLGYVMTYSGVAAIHAFVLVAARRKLLFDGWAWVKVSMGGSGLENLAVWPMTWDEDCDPVLAVVGTGFLLVTPMQLWSQTFRQAHSRKPILLLWSLLMLIGTICAFINETYVDVWAFPQYRFCSGSAVDEKLPVWNSGTRADVLSETGSVGALNETIWATFREGGFSGCLYPCFHARWPLRVSTDIIAIESVGTYPSSTNVDPGMGWRVMAVVYFLVCSSAITSLILFFARMAGYKPRSEKEYLRFSEIPRFRRIGWILDMYLRVMSVVCFLGFVAWIEWVIWYFPKSETFEHVGQWGVVVLVALVMFAMLISQYADQVSRFCETFWIWVWRRSRINQEIELNG